MKLQHRLCALLLVLLLSLNLSACQPREQTEQLQETVPPSSEQEQPSPPEPPETAEKPSQPPQEPLSTKKEPYIHPDERDYPDSEAGQEQKAFDLFILEEFVSGLEDDYLAIHVTLQNPESFGIDKSSAAVTLGEAISEEYIAEARENNQQLKEQFESFRYDLLTEEQQETYQLYKYLLDSAITSLEGDFPYMSWAFTPMQGLQTNITSMLTEFDFYSKEDVEAYLAMMADIPRYVDDTLAFTEQQHAMGYGMPTSALYSAKDYCEKIIEAGENSALLTTVLHKLDSCELLSDKEKMQARSEARKIFTEELLPCYQRMYDTLFSLRNGNNELGLAHLDKGKEYYEYLFARKSGSDRSIPEAKRLLKSYLELSLEEISRIASEQPQLYRDYIFGEIDLGYYGINDMILDLEEQISANFPYIDPVDYTISYLDSELSVEGIGAYYVVPPLDSDQTQKIKVNPDGIGPENSLSTYTLIAHEGLPGHLYQNNYIIQNISEPFRLNTIISGYGEGYATYAELISLNYLSDRLDPDLIRLEQCYAIFSNSLTALCDIGVHYDGWTLEELEDFCGRYITMEDGTDLYEQLLGDPAAFQSYYMGLIEFLELRREAKDALGEQFNELEFHEALLKGGDLPFSLLRINVEKYIDSNRP